MTNEEFKNEIFNKCPELKNIKKNPNNLNIINHYNNLLFKRNKQDLFNLIEQEIETRFSEELIKKG